MAGTETFSQMLVWESLMLENGHTHPSPQMEPGHHNSVTSFMHSHTQCAFIIKTNVASKKKKKKKYFMHSLLGTNLLHYGPENAATKWHQKGTRNASQPLQAVATRARGTLALREHHGAAGPWRGVAATRCERLLWGLPQSPLCAGKGYFITIMGLWRWKIMWGRKTKARVLGDQCVI